MKKILTHENVITFILVSLACATAIVIIVPLVRKFVPGLKKTTTSTTTTAAT